MSYQIDECTGESAEVEELSSFLADFVSRGEGATKDVEGRSSETWRSRLGWWWDSNPYCRPDSPKGLMLRREGGELAGFFGFIPHDYILNGEIVPSLITTTTFVCRDSRDAALGLFLKAHRLRESFQFVDGGPNEEAQALLTRTGYQSSRRARVYFYPVKRLSIRPQSILMQGARLAAPRSNGGLQNGKLVTSLEEVKSVAPIQDDRLRKHVDRDTLGWYLSAGSRKKEFVGWCDENGVLQCYLIGSIRRRLGVAILLITDAAALDPAHESQLNELIAHVSRVPDEASLPGEVDVMAWPSLHTAKHHRSPLSIQHDANLFYRLPSAHAEVDRLSFPFEGDQNLL